MSKNLVIVESPAKAKTIEGYLGKDFTVKSSFGHVRDLVKKGYGVDIDKGFEPTYEVQPDKKKVVNELKALAKKSDTVWLASDDDREGEAIAWHLKEALDLDDAKTRRIVFREITKKAILNAIESPRDIDIDLVNAQQARRILDRLVGFELSPVLWKKIKRGLSAGRVQSVAVRMIVDREREITNFTSTSSYKIVAVFNIDGKELKAELKTKYTSFEEAKSFLESCLGADFTIADLVKKPGKKSPAPPFTTSTLQQEASRKLGYSVARTMSLAQRLYESGKITYMRTDSVNLSQFAIDSASEEITGSFGDEYLKVRHFKNKNSSAQEAHEAIRPTNFSVKSAGTDSGEQFLYQLIWKRAIASQMSEAQIEKTTATIDISKSTEKLVAQGEVITFDGFLKVYIASTDDEDEEQKGMLPPLSIGQNLDLNNITATEKYSRPPARYTEASLVKNLEEKGIGRPSTYAPTISTIQKREYVNKDAVEGKEREINIITLKNDKVTPRTEFETYGADKNKLVPTDIAKIVNDFLVEHFPNVTDYSFTARVEEEFDIIAKGSLAWKNMLGDFYKPFHTKIETSEEIDRSKVGGQRKIGEHPESGKPVYARIAKFGPVIQIGDSEDEEKPQFANLKKGQSIESITLEEALDLFKLPFDLGDYDGEVVTIGAGRFGPYVKHDGKFISLPKGKDPLTVDMDFAVGLIEDKRKADAPIAEYEGLPVQKGVGRFGPFIKWNGTFINVNKKYDFDSLTQNDVEQLIEDKKRKDIEKVIHSWEEEGIRVEKARWGRHNVIKGKIKIELLKDVDAKALTLEQCKKMIEEKTPKKKTKAKKK